jgi:hypothetical protein
MNEFENIDNQLPYNPSDVDIRQQTFSVNHIINMIAHGEVELWREADYQRRSNQWNEEQKSRLIESLIMRIPLPIFYLDGSARPWKIIDGLHRLTTLYTYIRGMSFRLVNLEYLKDLEGKTFEDLPFKYKRVIEESMIEAYIINPGTPDKVILNIFQRINTGGSTLSRQEIRNAYYRGLPVEFIDELSTDVAFIETTNGKISASKMRNKEATLRFFAFFKYLRQYSPPMEKFLDFSMESIYTINRSELNEIKESFKRSMMASKSIFHENTFYTLDINGKRESSSINIALFETWSVNIAKLNNHKTDILIKHRTEVLDRFISQLQFADFYKSISSSTASKKAVFTRFEIIDKLINDIVNAH